jgi:7-carboxy-7-deazaguanine synthase
MRIAEIFHSLQGEGRLTGTPSVFVRTSGCNLRCRFCDTPYASWTPEGEFLSVEAVVAEVEKVAGTRRVPNASEMQCVPDKTQHVVITGGEPMLVPELVPLCAELRRREMHITIETAGTRYLPVECDLMAVSPKMSNSTPLAAEAPEWIESHERNRAATDILRRLNAEYDCQFKFVVGSMDDCDEVRTFLSGLHEFDRGRVLLMPQGTECAKLAAIGDWLEPYCRENGLTFCPRRHIEWFGCCRGT